MIVAAHKSYYDILGVPKTATPKEIKKAYRQKALRHHPDKGGDEEEFKEITKSYETLSDPDQRQLYDNYGEAGVQPGAGPSASNFGFQGYGPGGGGNPFGAGGNPFEGFFGGGSGGGTSGFRTESFGGNGANINIDLSELLSQMMGGSGGGNAFFGGPQSRPQSSATGNNSHKTYTRDVHCSLEDLAQGVTKKLKVTFGAGHDKVYEIKLKPGWKEGTKLTFDKASTKRPTMVFVVKQSPHKYLRRVDNDLHYTCWISESQTQGGIRINIPLPTGETWSKTIPKSDDSVAVSNGEQLRIPKHGMPIQGGPARGDLVVEFRVRRSTPTTSS